MPCPDRSLSSLLSCLRVSLLLFSDLGGGYAHAILCPYIPSSSRRLSLRPQPLSYELVPLTAMSEDHLAAYEDEVAAFLTAHPHVNLLDVAGTFAAHRSALRYRRYYVASSVQVRLLLVRATRTYVAACRCVLS